MIVVGVVAAAALGAVIRAIATDVDAHFNRQMYGTVLVNVVGSFLLGLLAGSGSMNTVIVLGVGGLGSLTTFSTYISQIECINRQGRTIDAVLYGAGSLIAGIGAAYVGWVL